MMGHPELGVLERPVALVRSLEKQPADRYRVHGESAGTYKIFEHAGSTYLQINTFGSEFRRDSTHPSQTIQFGPEALVQLREILGREVQGAEPVQEKSGRFGLLRRG